MNLFEQNVESFRFALLVAAVFILVLYVLSNNVFGMDNLVNKYIPASHPDNTYHLLYKGALVAFSTWLAVGMSANDFRLGHRVTL
jgi:hypothetical protein